MAKKSYNKENWDNKKLVHTQLLTKFVPYEGFKVEDYYGVSILKIKKGGAWSIKLIHDYTTRGLTSSGYIVYDFKKVMSIFSILEWFAKDDHLRMEEDEDDIDFDLIDKDRKNDVIDF
jgi:hypothetical protein